MDATLKQSIALAIQARQPVLIWGGPGTGKTSFVNNIAKILNVPIETIIASIREPSDFGGLPIIADGGVTMAPPDWAKRLYVESLGKDGLASICFIDEISTAAPATQASLLRVIHEGVVGDLALPSGVAMAAAANPPEQAAGGWTLAPPLANRFVHFEWPTNAMAWSEGAIGGWDVDLVIPRVSVDFHDFVPAQMALVATYIRTRPNTLYMLPKNETEAGKAWASPRSWEMAAVLLGAIESTEGAADEDSKIHLMAGAIGLGPAQEFVMWLRELDLPNPEELLADPSKFKMPDRTDKQFAVISSVVTAVLSNTTEDRWMAGWEILAKAAKGAKGPDIAAFGARSLAKRISAELPPPTKYITAFTQLLQEAGAYNF